MTNEEFEEAAKYIAEQGLKGGSDCARAALKAFIVEYLEYIQTKSCSIENHYTSEIESIIYCEEIETEIARLKE